MAHQPLQPKLNEASSNADVIGGTLTSQPLSTFFSNQPGAVFNYDQMVDLPFLVFDPDFLKFSSSDVSGKWIFSEDLFQFLYHWETSKVLHMSMPIFALTANRFHDFDLEITLLCVKHERARGLYQVTIMPGYSAYYSDTTRPTDQMLYHRIIWDIEMSDTVSFNLSSPKNFTWRSRIIPSNMANIPMGVGGTVDPTKQYYFENDDAGPDFPTSALYTYQGKGSFAVMPIMPYNAGNVGPDTANVLIFARFINLRTAEYSPPFAVPPGEIPFYVL